jgi:hypothetical protein
LKAKYSVFIDFFPSFGGGLRMVACAAPLMMAGGLMGQLPEAPRPQQETLQQQGPNRGLPEPAGPVVSFFPEIGMQTVDDKLPPQTVMEKFMIPTRNTLNAWAVIKPAFAAGYKEVENTTPEFGQGPAGFGRYYWHTVLDETSENYMVAFVFPVLTHQDSRYYELGTGGFWRRTRYALSRTLVTRNDAGNEVFNSSEVLGAGAAAGLTNLYYPSRERTLSITAERWGLNMGFDALTYAGREFWPDVKRKVFKGRE